MPRLTSTATRPLTLASAAAAVALTAVAAQAQVNVPKPSYKYEKCYGVAKGASNDCFTTVNACGQTALKDRDPNAWVYVPVGLCRKLSGGALSPASAKKS
jgi:uncharacterized membrane protein